MARTRTAPLSRLPPGKHEYFDILRDFYRGRYAFSQIRNAAGRSSPFVGVTPAQHERILGYARSLGYQFSLFGSRISGPRTYQRTLNPVLEMYLPLTTSGRAASRGLAGVRDVTIQKSHIKELGVDNVHTSDLSVDVLNVNGYPPEKVERDADLLATALNDLGFTFPVRVFTQCRGHRFSGPSDSDRAAVDYLLEQVTSSTAPTHTELVLAARELYAVVDSCDVVLNAMDIRGA